MKVKLLTLPFFVIILAFASACAVSYSKFFANIIESEDTTYGYTPENPVTIMNHNLDKSIGSANYYVNCLRSENGSKLRLVEQKMVDNPKYDASLKNMDSHYTGEALTYGNGPTLDLYLLMAEERIDTIRIYINTYVSGTVKIPTGLKFKKESL